MASKKKSSVKRESKVKKSLSSAKKSGMIKKKSVKIKEAGYSEHKLKTEKSIAMDFAEAVHKKFGNMIKATVLFGSQSKNTAGPSSDIDIIVIVDDAVINWDMEMTAWYREELYKIVRKQKHHKELHINTIRLTTWWEDLLHGDPVVINILRYGEALMDIGSFFNPIKALLIKGKIKSTPEAVHAALQRAPGHIIRSRLSEMSAIEGTYWAMVDSAQAALMTAGKVPPSPEHIPELLKETFVDQGMLKIGYVKGMRDLYTLHKSITRGQVNDIKGAEIDEWQELSEKFLTEMVRIVDTLLEDKGN
jgi:predicted nucleotidyltransferase/uncharacterized protein (UPF0332 family)